MACAMCRTGFGKPGSDPDRLAIDADFLTGGGGAALAVQEEFEDLRGLGEGSAGSAGGGQWVGLRGESDGGQQVLLPTGEGVLAGELAV